MGRKRGQETKVILSNCNIFIHFAHFGRPFCFGLLLFIYAFIHFLRALVYMSLLEKRIKKYESKFGVRVLEVHKLKSGRRFEFLIEHKKEGWQKWFRFGSDSRATYFDLVQKYERMKKGAPGSKAARNRAAYIARHSKIKLANGRKAINVVGPSSLSLIILW